MGPATGKQHDPDHGPLHLRKAAEASPANAGSSYIGFVFANESCWTESISTLVWRWQRLVQHHSGISAACSRPTPVFVIC
jgi:hypothetical protein